MNVERAAEVIAAYGADPARWPDDERAAALELIVADAELTRVRHSALTLDAELASWARRSDDVGIAPGKAAKAAAARVLTARTAMRPAARPAWRWVLGAGMAAAVAASVMLTNPLAAPRQTPAMHPQIALNPITDAAAFAMVFTPTPDEDGSI